MSLRLREIADLVLLEAFESLGIDASDWFRSSVFGEWAENTHAVRLREVQRDISTSLKWGPSIPRGEGPTVPRNGPEQRSSALFSLLGAEEQPDFINRSKGISGEIQKIEGVENSNISIDELLLLCKEKLWIPSTRYALDFCELIELPPQFAQAGSRSGVPQVVFSEPVESLPPLLDSRN